MADNVNGLKLCWSACRSTS